MNQFIHVKKIHYDSIINHLRKDGPTSRKVLAAKMGLTRASLTQMTNYMIHEGIIFEAGEKESKTKKEGRKEILLDVNYHRKQLIGIDIERNHVYVGIAYLNGEIIDSYDFPFEIRSAKKEEYIKLIDILSSMILDLLKKNNISDEDVLHCGVGIVGRSHQESLTMHDEEFMNALEENIHFPVSIQNNVRALAMAEKEFYSAKTLEDFGFVKIGPGLGSAIVLCGNLLVGHNNRLGELGHMLIDDAYPSSDSSFVTLEQIVTIQFIKQELEDIFSIEKTPHLYALLHGTLKDLEMRHLFEAITLGDSYIAAFIQKKAQVIAKNLYNIQVMLDLEIVILFFSSSHYFLYDFIKEEAQHLDEVFAKCLKLSDATKKTPYIGGIAVALSGYLEKT